MKIKIEILIKKLKLEKYTYYSISIEKVDKKYLKMID